jgi:hypothetical protein
MNTDYDLPRPNPGIENLLQSSPTPQDEQIGALEKQIQDLKNDHSREKFLWFLSALAIFDTVALLRAENWAAPIVIGIIQLVAVIVMADRCKVDTVAPLIDKLTGAFDRVTRKD